MVTHLSAAVELVIGEKPELRGYRGRQSIGRSTSLGYLGPNPSIIVFELAVILADQTARASHCAGYDYGPDDVVEELRHLVAQIDSPVTEALGTQILFYWPFVQLVGPLP